MCCHSEFIPTLLCSSGENRLPLSPLFRLTSCDKDGSSQRLEHHPQLNVDDVILTWYSFGFSVLRLAQCALTGTFNRARLRRPFVSDRLTNFPSLAIALCLCIFSKCFPMLMSWSSTRSFIPSEMSRLNTYKMFILSL